MREMFLYPLRHMTLHPFPRLERLKKEKAFSVFQWPL